MLETVHLAHIPPHLPVYIALFYEVQNIPFLRHQLLASNSEFEYAFIDASLVISSLLPTDYPLSFVGLGL